MRRLLIGMTVAVTVTGSGVVSAAGPHITDMAGDANGTNAGVDTRPASYDPADLLSVTMSTEYVAKPVGDDGIDYQAEALLIRFDTLTEPRPEAGALAFGLHARIGACDSTLTGYVNGSTTIAEPPGGRVRWVQFGECPDLPPNEFATLGWGTFVEHPQWTAAVDPTGSGVTLRIPFASLTAAQAGFLTVGKRLAGPYAKSWLNRSAYVIFDAGATAALAYLDETAAGADFTIGEDVPADVPCTSGCP